MSERSLRIVCIFKANEHGVPWFDVLDARSADTAMYIDLLDAEGSNRSVAIF
ncbi:MAG: hypothetical protein M3Y72_07160 [Acidobacteriota bacterium]|nr:hypothetical protein [Acidobacteriota bacterium]